MDALLSSLRTPADVIAAVPYLLGFTPTDSVVVMGVRAKKIVFQARADLPPADAASILASQLAEVLARQHVTGALIVGYGAAELVTPAVLELRDAVSAKAIKVLEALRATGGRYWSYLCMSAECCSPAGTPYDVATSAVAVSATVAGLSPAGSRDELVARFAPIGGPARLAMRDATLRADRRLCDLLDGQDTAPPASEVVTEAGRDAVDKAVLCMSLGAPLTDDDIAWLALLLVNPTVRDYAWARIGHDIPRHVELWTDAVRRVDPELAAAPATLLAFAAWRHGDGAIASIALDRARQADPNYPMAHLLAETILRGIAPGEWLDFDDDVARAVRQGRPRHRSTKRARRTA